MKNNRRVFFLSEQIWPNGNQYAANKNSVLTKLCIRLQYFYTPLSRIFDHCAARGSKPLTKQGNEKQMQKFRVIDATHPEKSVYFLSKGQTMKTFWREFTALSVSVCESILHSIGFLTFWLRFLMKYGNLGENLIIYLFIFFSSYFRMLWIIILGLLWIGVKFLKTSTVPVYFSRGRNLNETSELSFPARLSLLKRDYNRSLRSQTKMSKKQIPFNILREFWGKIYMYLT